jgi:hypothetical protein
MAPIYSFKVTKNIVADQDDRHRLAMRRKWEQSRVARALGLALIGFAVAALIVTVAVLAP